MIHLDSIERKSNIDLINENKELKRKLANLHPPKKLMRNALGLMGFSLFTYGVSVFKNIDLMHPYVSLSFFITGGILGVLSIIVMFEKKKNANGK